MVAAIPGPAVADDDQARQLINDAFGHLTAGKFGLALEPLITAARVADSTEVRLDAYVLLGSTANLNGDYALAERVFTFSIALFGVDGDPWQVVECYHGLAEAKVALGKTDAAVRLCSTAIGAFSDKVAPPPIGELYRLAGNALNRAGRGEEGVVWFERLFREQPSYGLDRELRESMFVSGIMKSGISPTSQLYRDKMQIIVDDPFSRTQRGAALALSEVVYSLNISGDMPGAQAMAELLYIRSITYDWHLVTAQQLDPELRSEGVTRSVRNNMATALSSLVFDTSRLKDPALLPLSQEIAFFMLSELADTGTVLNFETRLHDIVDR